MGTVPHGLRRRDLLGALAAAGLLGTAPWPAHSAPGTLIENVTRLYPVRAARVVVPTRVQEMVQDVQH